MTSGMDRRRSEAGQATVELMLVLPVIVTLALLLAQVGLVARDSVMIHHAAREAARAAAVVPTDETAQIAATGSSRLDPSRLEVALSGGRTKGDHITATVTYSAPTDIPIVGRMLPDVMLQAKVTMRVE
jgi:Flp pilus assembly protein TadG